MIEFEVYTRPNGHHHTSEITKIYPEDALFFRQHGIKISAEQIGQGAAFYFDYGERDAEGSPVELVLLVDTFDSSPYEFFAKARAELSEIMGLTDD